MKICEQNHSECAFACFFHAIRLFLRNASIGKWRKHKISRTVHTPAFLPLASDWDWLVSFFIASVRYTKRSNEQDHTEVLQRTLAKSWQLMHDCLLSILASPWFCFGLFVRGMLYTDLKLSQPLFYFVPQDSHSQAGSTNMDYGLKFKVTLKFQHVHFLHLYRPSGLQLSIKNSSTFERVRVFRLTTAIAWCLLLHSLIPVLFSFCMLSFRLFLFSFLYLHSHMAGAIAKRRWSCIHFGIQGLVGKNTKENMNTFHSAKFWVFYHASCFSKDNSRRKGFYFSE